MFIEIPEGSIPLDNSYYSQLYHLNINSFTTTSFSVRFYFPNEGSFNMYHPIAAKGTTILSVGQPLKFTVNEAIDYNKLQQLKNEENLLKEELYDEKKIYNSNKLKDVLTAGGKDEEIISFFKNEAFTENDVELVLWLVHSTESFYNELIKIVRSKGIYCHNLWVYGFKYKDVETIREYLSNNEHVFHCKELLGPNFESSLVVSNETDYEKISSHLEYMNLVNARAHPLGKRETNIMNNEFNEQYQKFIIQTIQSLEVTLRTKLRLVYYLILQERFNEAKVQFDKVTRDEVNEYKKKGNRSFEIQYDYLSAYLDFCFGLCG